METNDVWTQKEENRMKQYGEAVFSTIYLLFGFIAAIILLSNATGREVIVAYGILTLVLAGGDSFHLVPRILNAFLKDFKSYEFWAGLGLMISSITMTIFYLILFSVWKSFGGTRVSFGLDKVLWICAIIRILLCLFPQNNWFHKEGNKTWGILRNVPFAVVGLIMIYLFASIGMWNMAIAILLSFSFYFPVVLFAKKNPKVGMLMIPKTMAYMWMIGIGLALL